MGSGRCWVCAGRGIVERRIGKADCPSCDASGTCRYCTAQPGEEAVTIRLDAPVAATADRVDSDGGATG